MPQRAGKPARKVEPAITVELVVMSAPCTTQREATLRDDAERLEAEAAALEASCASLEAENASIEAVMKLRLGDARIGAPVKALLPVVDADPCSCTA